MKDARTKVLNLFKDKSIAEECYTAYQVADKTGLKIDKTFFILWYLAAIGELSTNILEDKRIYCLCED